MRCVFFANNRLALRVLDWLAATEDRPIGLVVHPTARANYRDEIIALSGLGHEAIRDETAISTPVGIRWLRDLAPDWLISVGFGYVLLRDVLEIPSCGAVNLHTGLLPFNRGAHPNVWSIVDRTPAGVTLHHMDVGIDTGDIIAQREVAVSPMDTGATLYAKLEDTAVALFRVTWPELVKGTAGRRPQPPGGTLHRTSDVRRLDRLDPNGVMRVADMIDILRARTFPPYAGAYLDLPTGRVYVRISLTDDPQS